ncbi:MAG: serine hydrolase, partial [Planctomycetota bacterium]|nr:serine hydrolase [Planctomycetota bacterium]
MTSIQRLTVLLVLVLAPSLCSAQSIEPSSSAPKPEYLELAKKYSASKKGVSLLIMYDGKIVYEKYSNFGGKDKAWKLASGTKSFTGIAYLFAQKDGLLKIDEKACKTLSSWKSDPQKNRITLRQLMTLTSGLKKTRKLRMSYKDGVDAPMSFKPGEKFEYGPVNYSALGAILTKKLAAKKLGSIDQYLETKLFKKIGLEVGAWKKGPDNNVMLSHGMALTAQNWAKFGEWLRVYGKHNGKSLLSAEALKKCEQGTKANPAYGLTFWLNRPVQKDLKDSIPLFQQTDVIN